MLVRVLAIATGVAAAPVASRTAAAVRCCASASATARSGRRPPPRLYCPTASLRPDGVVAVADDQRHKLGNVLRLRQGDVVTLFNGVDGDWSARIEMIDRRACELRCDTQLRPQPSSTAVLAPTLLFGVLKAARLPTLVEKATELGVAELQPVITQHCHARDLNLAKLASAAAGAAEQCGRLTVPRVRDPIPLLDAVAALERRMPARPLCVCDERGGAPPLSSFATRAAAPDGVDVLIGPEGGFSDDEFAALDAHALTTGVGLGPNILRAETAALAALAVLACV